MDFELSDDQRMILDNVSTFVKKDSPVDRFRKQRDQEPGWSKAVWQQMGELGWLGLPFPETWAAWHSFLEWHGSRALRHDARSRSSFLGRARGARWPSRHQ